jgi:site-specific DNA-methyltransferase (adenine-specific)
MKGPALESALHHGDCATVARAFPDRSVDLVYLDPPFFTQKIHKLKSRDRKSEFSFPDQWASQDGYAEFLRIRLQEFHRVLAPTGSLFFHCDRNAAPVARLLLDEVFGRGMFRAEIIWHYRRWSRSQRNLLPAHQTIYFYSKSARYKFHDLLQEYSASTNVDQILQKRRRDESGKAVYARDAQGRVISGGAKKGVPLSDVWDIPYLNPKARERTGYPTQKPVLLLERILRISTDEGDIVLDPFCGSGTTLVAAQLLHRRWIGIDTSQEALRIARQRLARPLKTHSPLLEKGRGAYANACPEALAHLAGLDIVPVQRNRGIDAFLKEAREGGPVPIRVQRPHESVEEAARLLSRAARNKQAAVLVLVVTREETGVDPKLALPPGVELVESTALRIRQALPDPVPSLSESDLPGCEDRQA